MRRLSISAASLGTALCVFITLPIKSAEACSFLIQEDARVSAAYRTDAVSAVVLVRVEKSAYTGDRPSRWPPFQVTANADRVLIGNYRSRQVVFEGGGGPSACDLGYPIPNAGEEWIVYISKKTGRVLHAFPREIAAKADPKIYEHLPSLRR